MTNKKVTLPSKAILEISLAPFSDANALNKAIALELKNIKLDKDLELGNPEFLKTLFCSVYASEKIMECLQVCMKRCTRDGLKITEEIFEDEKGRGDYLAICKEVLLENIRPFVSGLSSQFGITLQEMTGESK